MADLNSMSKVKATILGLQYELFEDPSNSTKAKDEKVESQEKVEAEKNSSSTELG